MYMNLLYYFKWFCFWDTAAITCLLQLAASGWISLSTFLVVLSHNSPVCPLLQCSQHPQCILCLSVWTQPQRAVQQLFFLWSLNLLNWFCWKVRRGTQKCSVPDSDRQVTGLKAATCPLKYIKAHIIFESIIDISPDRYPTESTFWCAENLLWTHLVVGDGSPELWH